MMLSGVTEVHYPYANRQRGVVGITVDWDNPQKTIIRQVYGATWNWDEFLAALKQIDALAAEVDHPLGLLADASAIRQLPPANAIMYGTRALSNMPSNVILIVVVSPSRLALSIIRTVQTVTRFNMQVASSLEDGRLLIEAERNKPPHK
jgi:hypothetical protein